MRPNKCIVAILGIVAASAILASSARWLGRSHQASNTGDLPTPPGPAGAESLKYRLDARGIAKYDRVLRLAKLCFESEFNCEPGYLDDANAVASLKLDPSQNSCRVYFVYRSPASNDDEGHHHYLIRIDVDEGMNARYNSMIMY